MTRVRTKLTSERAKQLLKYEPDNGTFTWISRSNSRSPIRIGKRAGSLNKATGYIAIQVDGITYPAHCVAWLIQTGQWPSGEIDHINSSRADNRFVNLRDVPVGVNQQNRRHPQANNTTGFLGVSRARYGFQATISFRGKNKNLGTFNTAEAAYEAYVMAKRQIHAACTI